MHEIKPHTAEVRTNFNQYQDELFSLTDVLTSSNEKVCLEECKTLENLSINRTQIVQDAITQANARRRKLQSEIISSHRSHGSSISSTTPRALARTEALAALKKVETQKRRSAIESQSAL